MPIIEHQVASKHAQREPDQSSAYFCRSLLVGHRSYLPLQCPRMTELVLNASRRGVLDHNRFIFETGSALVV